MIHPLTLEQLKLGMVGNLAYLVKVDEDVNYETYEPMSYENWKLYRDLSPGKMSSTYEGYCRLKEESYKDEIKRRANIQFELKMVSYNTYWADLEKSKQRILDIENSYFFKEWCGESTVEIKDIILNL